MCQYGPNSFPLDALMNVSVMDCWRGNLSNFFHVLLIISIRSKVQSIFRHIYVFTWRGTYPLFSGTCMYFWCHQSDPKYKVFLAYYIFWSYDRKATHDWMAAICYVFWVHSINFLGSRIQKSLGFVVESLPLTRSRILYRVL